jgi:hypothetical protein
MSMVLTLIVFVALAAAVAAAGMKLYVRPKEAMERVVGGIEQPEHLPLHPSLAFHELIKRLATSCRSPPRMSR